MGQGCETVRLQAVGQGWKPFAFKLQLRLETMHALKLWVRVETMLFHRAITKKPESTCPAPHRDSHDATLRPFNFPPHSVALRLEALRVLRLAVERCSGTRCIESKL
jgi:hypothetical protein